MKRDHPSSAAKRSGVFYLKPWEAHKACRLAYEAGGRTCSRCAVLLHPNACECDQCGYAKAHMEAGDE